MVLTEENDVGDDVSESSSDSKHVALRVGSESSVSGVTVEGEHEHWGAFSSDIADPDVRSTLLGLAEFSSVENGS